jgi:hypothetical protein
MQRIGKLGHIVGPIQQGTTRLKVRQAIPGSIKRDDARTELEGNRVIWVALPPRSRQSMEKEDRCTCKIAIFGVTQYSPIS